MSVKFLMIRKGQKKSCFPLRILFITIFGSSAESVGEKSDKPAQCLKRRQRLGLAHMGDPEVLVVSESHIFQALYSSRRSIRFHRVGFRDR